MSVEFCTSPFSAPSSLFDFAPSTTFPSCWIGSYDILIGSNDGSSLAVCEAGLVGGATMNKLPLSNPSREAIEREIMKERIREEILAREMVERRILEEEVRREIAMERIIELRRLQMERWPGLASTSGMVMHGDRQTQTLKPSCLEAGVVASLGRGIAQDGAEFAFRDRSSSHLLPKKTTAVMAQPAVRHESEKRSPSNETTTSNSKLSGAKRMIQAKKQWGCALCKVSSSSEQALKEHLQGRKHKAKEALLLSNKKTGLLQSKQNVRPPLEGASDGGPLKKKLSEGKKQQKLWCSLCKVKCNSSFMLENHLAGRKHRNFMELKKANFSCKTKAVKDNSK